MTQLSLFTNSEIPDSESMNFICYSPTDKPVTELLDLLHNQYKSVLNNDLSGGYNSYYGTHIGKLN